ncbi:MAG TPA: ABC transporter ATP-binding protein [Candidatus Baltobacteraceae bacterium]|jgi:branched-chain amino acid transport system ATP-binding protein|nr:ABC transporter ATP-binding protein [Candidatus Baltobacteraceae bacterium]
MTIAADSALRVTAISAGYGQTQVLWDVSLEIQPGETVALIGSNGAGKSTLLAAISGLVPLWRGQVLLGVEEIGGRGPAAIVAHGVIQVPQGRRLFGGLSVRENLFMGTFLRRDGEIDADIERVLQYFPRVRERYNFLAGRLSGGEQQQVAIARALMARPKVLLIDEMSLGLAPVIVESLLEVLERIRASGVSILMVEQDVQTALEFAQRAYVLENGRIVLTGRCADLLDDPAIRRAYLGV